MSVTKHQVPDNHVPILAALGWVGESEGQKVVYLSKLDILFGYDAYDGTPYVRLQKKEKRDGS